MATKGDAPNSRSEGTGSKVAAGIAIGAASVALGVVAAGAAVAGSVARTIVVPPRRREEDIAVRAVDLDGTTGTITLQRTPDSVLEGKPGQYSFWFAGGDGHAVLGAIVARDEDTVTRKVLRVGFGDLTAAKRGRLSGWIWLSPREAGLPSQAVVINGPVGPNPAWLIPAKHETDIWAIHIHGRASKRAETLRGVKAVRESGLTSLVISYRNDGEATDTQDGRYALGDTEWQDVEAAVEYALAHGAKQVVLFGWSMGGAIALQTTIRSSLAPSIAGVILDSPVVDWIESLRYQGDANRLPGPVQSTILTMIGRKWGRAVTGQHQPIELSRLNWLERASDLSVPVLLMHSDDDGYIPSGPSRELAAERPELVTYVAFTVARHCKLWNYDRARWNSSIATWLTERGLAR